ncbi:TagK domain-containing protein [Variovorax humicola]|uniref:TagK domain-containing protein n=1 Tax=Variovorax humicola TaxID=1769758 RepID=A0ABU8WDG5_9BURK
MNIDPVGESAASAAAPSLLLRLVRSHGKPVDGTLSVPAAGVGLADALALDARAPNDEDRRQADLCRIGLRGRSWQLSNDSHALACTLNGQRVPAGTVTSVADRDVLELGLLRFVVELADSDVNAAAFDLRNLALSPRQQSFADPFGVLDIDGARPQSVANPLGQLLGELPVAKGQAAKGLTAASAAIPPLREISRREHRPQPGSADALFDDLHEGFIRAVRDPSRLAESALWENSHALAGEATLTTLEDLTRDAVATYPLVRDVLHDREKIDQLFDGVDSWDKSPLFEPQETEEVLRLFAPELAHSARKSIPSLTRREHHALSPDSPMPIESTRQGTRSPDGPMESNRDAL